MPRKYEVTQIIESLASKSQSIDFMPGDMAAICGELHSLAPDEVFNWAFATVKRMLCAETASLSQAQYGFHFNMASATSDFMDGSFMQVASDRMRNISPRVWDMVIALLDANPDRRRARPILHPSIIEGLSSSQEGTNLVEIEGAGDVNEDPGTESDDEMQNNDGSEAKSKRRARRAEKRNASLLIIKAVVCTSIFLHSTNEQCNYLQSILGFFYHSASVPEKVIETLAHAGLSVGLTSIHSGIKSLSREAETKIKESVRTLQTAFAYDNFDINFKNSAPTVERQTTFISSTSATAVPLYGANPDVLRCSAELWQKDPRNPSKQATPIPFDINILRDLHKIRAASGDTNATNAWHVRDILIKQVPAFSYFANMNGQPKEIKPIPVHKTTQIPCRAMKVKESTADGNIEVIETLLRQGGIGDPNDNGFRNSDIDMTEHIVLIHGDLLTKERLESVQDSRRIEDTPKNRFQFAVFVPGLFHFKMAAADAIARIYAQPPQSRTDPNSLYQHVGILRPKDVGKFVSKPGFRRVHDVIHHDIWASILDCWSIESRARNPSWTSLEKFADSRPGWDVIVQMSKDIVRKYVATVPGISSARKKPDASRDQMWENQVLRNRDELLYLELSHAMNAGDIGRVEQTFPSWIYLFHATGKHKYSTHTLHFLFKLHRVFSPELSNLIRMNWLCNPTGKPHGFRGVDWMVERNNLYTKVIYGGSGSNRTIERIIEESVLIELFRECHVTIENGFHLEHRSIRHSPPNMVRTLQKLGQHIKATSPHEFRQGREVQYIIPDHIAGGMAGVQTAGKYTTVSNEEDGEESVEVDEGDLGA